MLPHDVLRSDILLNSLDVFYNLSISKYASDNQSYPVSSLRGRAIALLDIGVHVVCIASAISTLLHRLAHLVYRTTLHIRFLKTDVSEEPHSLVAPVLNALVALTLRTHIIRADLYGVLVPEWGRTCRVFYSLHILRKPINPQEHVADLLLARKAAELQIHTPPVTTAASVEDKDSLLDSAFEASAKPRAPPITTAPSVEDDDSLLDSAFDEVVLKRSSACEGIASKLPAANAGTDDLGPLLHTLDRIKMGLSPTERTRWDYLFQKISDAATQKQPVTQLLTQCSLWMQKYLFLCIQNFVPTAVQQSVDKFVHYVQQIEQQHDIWKDVLYVEIHKLAPPSEIENNPQLLLRWIREEAHRAHTGELKALSSQTPVYDIEGFNMALLATRQDFPAHELVLWEPLLQTLEEGVAQHQEIDSFMFYFREDLRLQLIKGLSGMLRRMGKFMESFTLDFIIKQPTNRAHELRSRLEQVPFYLSTCPDVPINLFDSHEIFADWLIRTGRAFNH